LILIKKTKYFFYEILTEKYGQVKIVSFKMKKNGKKTEKICNSFKESSEIFMNYYDTIYKRH
jgi:sugar-specific transcriptional regulator TrmB